MGKWASKRLVGERTIWVYLHGSGELCGMQQTHLMYNKSALLWLLGKILKKKKVQQNYFAEEHFSFVRMKILALGRSVFF